MDFIDVNGRSEIPRPPSGQRYLDFLGGEKELRCYLVAESTPRSEFLREQAELLDKALDPIYQNNGLYVRQDASYALPGFYIVSYDQRFPSLDAMDEITHLRISFVQREVRKAMREVLGIEYIHLYYEEKPDPSCNVHYWMMPMKDPITESTTVIMRLDLRSYLSGFRFSEQRHNIYDYNDKMRTCLAERRLSSREDEIANLIVPRVNTFEG